ncbi:MAG: N-acetylmuramoyl-L-alanine amidase [Desulfobacterales bacterium]|jgi:N-acetylmuramoyl-L-alanine amidase
MINAIVMGCGLSGLGFKTKKIYIIIILFFCCGGMFWPYISEAVTAREKYYQSEACYRDLRANAQKRKYRDNWLQCIEKFQSVFQLDPDGPWAAAGLYMSAELYRELARYSGKQSDLNEALDSYKRIIKRFPDSRYRQKAERAIRTIAPQDTSTQASKDTNSQKTQPSKSSTDAARKAYYSAEACYNELRNDSKKIKYRHNWLRCIEGFHDVYRHDPAGPWAAAGLYMTAKLNQELYNWSRSQTDLEAARGLFEQIIEEFPESRYKIKATSILASLPQAEEYEPISKSEGLAQKTEGTVKLGSSPSKGWATVDYLRFWSNPNYTRVVIDADKETSFSYHLLKKDPSINKPQRLYVDLQKSRLGKNIKKLYPIDDDLLSDARAGQYTPNTVRVVVDIKSFKNYNIFSLKDPFRIVIDIWGAGAKQVASTPAHIPIPEKGLKLPPSALAKQLALGVRRIVIDPGHGGKDYGAPGYLRGVHEKKVVLAIAKRLAEKIQKELGAEVILTRSGDKFMTLEERTAFANTKNADLFISIHTNSHKNRRAYGIETYFLNLATDDEAIRVAALENATSTKNISDLQSILNDLMQNAKINESSRLAVHVQSSIVSHLKSKRWTRIKDKGVKQAPFYVLLGAQMPSILIETSFISNPRECKRLTDPTYQNRLCEAIVLGIKKYIKETTPTAFIDTRPTSRSGG